MSPAMRVMGLLVGGLLQTSSFVAPGRTVRHGLATLSAKYKNAAGEPIKASLSAYLHFCADERTALTAELKKSLGEKFENKMVMSKLGERWRALPAPAAAKYQGVAAADKARFDAEIAGAGIVTAAAAKKVKSTRPLTAYMLFCQERRTALTAELKGAMAAAYKPSLVMVKLGEEWRAMTDKTKVKYTDMAAAQ
ncbi:hypothetical protein M885DRAFT_505978 [Pelagophyceae sp. CCMP2097]|nr:hypothetical protein M885DRAFT_505978 [Pelagophyceae sp. CCMP2097]|mmetsp:Transcript_31656/g.106620  ORF Transcript_31656/g.106620 Transcript_31656/m.106620 type:complete len:194 (-) Transcript_31656:206-787(-)